MHGLMTRFGQLNFEIRAEGTALIFVDVAGISMPAGGLFIMPPLPPGHHIHKASDSTGLELFVDSKAGCVTLVKLPCTLTLLLSQS
jgi:hypothetical protein